LVQHLLRVQGLEASEDLDEGHGLDLQLHGPWQHRQQLPTQQLLCQVAAWLVEVGQPNQNLALVSLEDPVEMAVVVVAS